MPRQLSTKEVPVNLFLQLPQFQSSGLLDTKRSLPTNSTRSMASNTEGEDHTIQKDQIEMDNRKPYQPSRLILWDQDSPSVHVSDQNALDRHLLTNTRSIANIGKIEPAMSRRGLSIFETVL